MGFSMVIVISNVLETQQCSSRTWRIECRINGQDCTIGQLCALPYPSIRFVGPERVVRGACLGMKLVK